MQLNGNQAGLSHIDHISCPGETSCRNDAAKLNIIPLLLLTQNAVIYLIFTEYCFLILFSSDLLSNKYDCQRFKSGLQKNCQLNKITVDGV